MNAQDRYTPPTVQVAENQDGSSSVFRGAMKAFRGAPWYLKLLLLFLPFVLIGKLISYAFSIRTAAAHGYPLASLAWLVEHGIEICFVAAVTWFAWRPRPLSRWLVAAIMLLAIARNVYKWLCPSGTAPFLATSTVIEDGNGSSLGAILFKVFLLWWAYVCVFTKRSRAFYRDDT